MTLFEDLVVALKEENLLEDTFIELNATATNGKSKNGKELAFIGAPAKAQNGVLSSPGRSATIGERNGKASYGLTDVEPQISDLPETEASENASINFQGNNETVEIKKPDSEAELYKKRALGELSSLQMVEAILSAVERERMKVVRQSYDDLEAKKALHHFLQVVDDTHSEAHKSAEFALLAETEAWCSALAIRDREIPVNSLRQYAENCRPILSSQALLALARFYRNLPYSESVRGKYDCIITRLFSRPSEAGKRMLLFASGETQSHVKSLYADWSSVPLYSTDDNESNISLSALSFADLQREAEAAKSFDELLKSDFFGRMRLFKESIAEIFYAPAVTAAAIECNIRVGNIYVDLISHERDSSNAAIVHQKYADIDGQIISEAAGRTLELFDMLRDPTEVPEQEEDEIESETEAEIDPNDEPITPNEKQSENSEVNGRSTLLARLQAQIVGFNRRLLIGCSLLLFTAVVFYVWTNLYTESNVSNDSVKVLSFQGTEFADNVKLAKISGETLYIVSQPSLDTMTQQEQSDVLQRLYSAGDRKGWVNVNLMNSKGKTVGYASPTKIEIY